MTNEDCVEAFQIGQYHQLFQQCIVADVAPCIGVGFAPFFCGLAKQGDIEQVRFVGIDQRYLQLGDGRRYECLADGIRVDVVIDLGQGALEIPSEFETLVFVLFEALELLDQVEFEFRTEP